MKHFPDRRAGGPAAARPPRTGGGRPALEKLEDRFVPSVTTLDLTAPGAQATDGVAIFQQASPQPTGSGVIHSFVRLHAGGNGAVEQGYNTDARPLQYDENSSPTFTRSLRLTEAPVVVLNGVGYREFLLDINQKSSSPLLSLDELRIYLGGAPNLTGYDPATRQLAGLPPVYDLDAGGDNTVLLNARLSHGSGSGDLFLYVPDALLTAAGGDYLYLYSKFGTTVAGNGGFEEWAVRAQANPLSSLSGYVYFDQNRNGAFDQGDTGIADVLVTLTGVNDLGQAVSAQAWTDANGFYLFDSLRAGTYNITETQPTAYQAFYENLGTLGGTVGFDQFTGVALPAGVIGRNYDFGNVLPLPPGS
jgi:hypothetical protein